MPCGPSRSPSPSTRSPSPTPCSPEAVLATPRDPARRGSHITLDHTGVRADHAAALGTRRHPRLPSSPPASGWGCRRCRRASRRSKPASAPSRSCSAHDRLPRAPPARGRAQRGPARIPRADARARSGRGPSRLDAARAAVRPRLRGGRGLAGAPARAWPGRGSRRTVRSVHVRVLRDLVGVDELHVVRVRLRHGRCAVPDPGRRPEGGRAHPRGGACRSRSTS